MKRGVEGVRILLFCINCVGIAGALMEALLIDWRGGLNQPLFWGGMILICGLSALCWSAEKRSGKARRAAVVLCVYAVLFLLFWEMILNGWSWSLQKLQMLLREYYDSGWVFQHGMQTLQQLGEHSAQAAAVRSFGLLMFFVPVELLSGLAFFHGKWQVFIAEHIVWLTAACITDEFPGVLFLVLCVTGVVLAAAAGEFGGSAAAWMQASAGILALTLLGVLLIYRFFLPVLNEQYELRTGLRHEIYVTVNYRWVPALQKLMTGYGPGSGVDVTGAFGRRRSLSDGSTGIYRVTLSSQPSNTLYLRGFVGSGYEYREWKPEREEALPQYYRENDFAPVGDGRELLNIGYEAMSDRRRPREIQIAEMLAEGSYSLLPYGALVPEGFSVHRDGAVDRQGQTYGFQYKEFSRGGQGAATEEQTRVERQYRRYVYDSFLDYPAERLPRLTALLEQMQLPKDSVYDCARSIVSFLDERANYQLDVAATPLGEDFVEYFLFESERGYCTHFASAAVLMFRYCGIPARYAAGYCASPQSFRRGADNLYEAVLSESQAHAWAEVYVDGVGWMPIEATPGAVAFAGDNRMEMLTTLGLMTGDVKPVMSGSFVEEDEEEEEEEEEEEFSGQRPLPLPDEEEPDEEEPGPEPQGTEWRKRILRWLPAAAFAGLAAAAGVSVVRLLRWNRKLKRVKGREKVFLLYRNMRNALHLMGCSKRLTLTGDSFWERLQDVLPSQNWEEYETLCRIVEQSSFGAREPSGDEVEALGYLHDEMVHRLYLRAPFYKRAAFAGLACCTPGIFNKFQVR